MKKHFVKFFSPGTFFSEEREFPIFSWDVEAALALADTVIERYGATPYAFQFITRVRNKSDLDSRIKSVSDFYFLGGKILTLAQIRKRRNPKDKILISNMENNRVERVVENRNSWKITVPFGDGDTLLDYTPPNKRKTK